MALGAMMAGGNPDLGRHEDDFYPTPEDACRSALPLMIDFPDLIWEPACGDGALSRVLRAGGYSVVESDVNPRVEGATRQSFFDFKVAPARALVTNPPFELADQFIAHARTLGIEHMLLFLKATFYHAKKRRRQFAEFRPAAIYPLTWRVDFTGQGRATMECSWFLWEPGATSTAYHPIPRPKSASGVRKRRK